jgi:hypothetical protein
MTSEMSNDDEPTPSRRGALLAMALIAAVVVLVILVVQRLHQSSAIQDCVMSGRTNCAPIEAPQRQ